MEVQSYRVILAAAGITFYTILALFPGIAALVALYGLFADPATISAHLDNFTGVLPQGATDVVRDELNRVASQGASTLGVTALAYAPPDPTPASCSPPSRSRSSGRAPRRR